MRLAFRAREIMSDGDEMDVVVKCFKDEVLQEDESERELLLDEAMTQMVAEDYAQQFNKLAASRGLRHCLAFLPVSVVILDDESVYSMEPYLPGDYVKYNDNAGHVEREDEAATAYSYFTYVTSGGAIVICDIRVPTRAHSSSHAPRVRLCPHVHDAFAPPRHHTRHRATAPPRHRANALPCTARAEGVGTFYTDPQIHTLDGAGFGAGNLGEEGVRRFMASHRHSLLCEQLGLASPDADLTDEELAAKLQADEQRIAAEEEADLDAQMIARLQLGDESDR
jgi:hypothetical protein